MNRLSINLEVLNLQATSAEVQKSKNIPPLWDQLNLLIFARG